MRERELLIAALRFYADPANWHDGGFREVESEIPGITAIECQLSSIDKDQGEKAREALGEKK